MNETFADFRASKGWFVDHFNLRLNTYDMLKVIFFALICSMISVTSFACECTAKGAFKSAIADSSAIFLGNVRSVQGSLDQSFANVGFEVERSWKKIRGFKAQVKVRLGKTCGYKFEIGTAYLVFVDLDGFVSSCGWSKPKSEAEADIANLGPIIPLK